MCLVWGRAQAQDRVQAGLTMSVPGVGRGWPVLVTNASCSAWPGQPVRRAGEGEPGAGASLTLASSVCSVRGVLAVRGLNCQHAVHCGDQ